MKELLELNHDERITLFTLSNFNNRKRREKFHFTNNVGIVFDGVSYEPLSCKIEGIEYSGEGAVARPKLTVADPEGYISQLIELYQGLTGAYLEVITTLVKFTDRFRDTRDPTAIITRDLFIISQKTIEIPGVEIEFELSVPGDFVDESFPGRTCMTKCPWVYRGEECGYDGDRYFDMNNNRVRKKEDDYCNKTLRACERRFGRDAVLPFGGFPGLQTRYES